MNFPRRQVLATDARLLQLVKDIERKQVEAKEVVEVLGGEVLDDLDRLWQTTIMRRRPRTATVGFLACVHTSSMRLDIMLQLLHRLGLVTVIRLKSCVDPGFFQIFFVLIKNRTNLSIDRSNVFMLGQINGKHSLKNR
jgi:hypothetical protein